MKISIARFLCVLLLASSIISCARRGNPTGGPKDSIPPILIKAEPKIESINFDSDKIKIYFDEYIKLQDLKKNLVISPPAKHEPIITPVGTASKFITIEILDTLDAKTTYQFNFGNSIVDNNEGNEAGNFKYVFSTGDFIDSLKLSGEVLDPKVKEKASDIDVMLYEYDENYTDSIIFKEKPRYIANTLDSTLYELTNLRAGKYLLIALRDGNNNKMYDPRTDKIGYIQDTVTIPTDETINFNVFKEILELNVLRPKEESKGHLIFGYEGDVSDLNIKLLSQTPTGFKSIINLEEKSDTLNYWYTPFEVDSLLFEISKGDYIDSLVVKPNKKEIDSVIFTPSTKGTLNLLDTFSIRTNVPIANFDRSKISLIKDSLPMNFETTLSKSKTKLYIDFEKEFSSSYSLEILPNTMSDIFGISNDSISLNLSTKTPEDYGTIVVNVTSSQDIGFIVDLLNENETIIRTEAIDSPQEVRFELLDPGNYLIRVTYDTNKNGKWDTGNFLLKKQPEKVKYIDKLFELRANWEPIELFNADNN